MMRKSVIVTVFVLFFTTDCSLAEEITNPSKEDLILVVEKIYKILQEKDNDDKIRTYYPYFLEILVRFGKQMQEQNKEPSFKDDRWENAVEIPESTRDVSNSVLRFMSAWFDSEFVKPKRGYHRALCHFKICNMGTKRSKYFDDWQNNPQ